MTSETNPQYRLTLEAQPDKVAANARLKRLLKIAIRQLGLKCVKIQELNQTNSPKGEGG